MKRVLGFNLFFVVIGCLSLSVMAAPHRIKWPDNVAPKDVYAVVMQMNDYADAIIKKRKLKVQSVTPNCPAKVSPTLVYQLHLSIIQLLHYHELQLGLRPIPIVTSSPIPYYPVDVKYLSELILDQMRIIAKQYQLPTLKHPPRALRPDVDSEQVFCQSIQFYLKLLALSGQDGLTADQLYNQFLRARLEMQNIVAHQLPLLHDAKTKRHLATALYGFNPDKQSQTDTKSAEPTMTEIYQKAQAVSTLLKPLLAKLHMPNELASIKMGKGEPTGLDVFMQSQILLAELSEWKDIIDVVTSSPITVSADKKTNQAVYLQLQALAFMIQKLTDVI